MNKLQEHFQNRKKDILLNKIVGNLGECEIENGDNSKIICYVDNEKLKKRFNFNSIVPNIDLNSNSEYRKNMEFDNPIYYVIDGMNFEKGIIVNCSEKDYILFKNCVFNNIIYLNCHNVVFSNNIYNINPSFSYLYANNKYFINSNFENSNISFINEKFTNNSYDSNNYSIGIKNAGTIKVLDSAIDCDKMDLEARNIIIANSSICSNELNFNMEKTVINSSLISSIDTYLDSNYLALNSSKTLTNYAYIDSDNISFDDKSEIVASNGVFIEDKNVDILNVNSPTIIYNNIVISDLSDIEEMLRLRLSRERLITVLENIKNNCDINNNERLKHIADNMKKTAIKKLIKK